MPSWLIFDVRQKMRSRTEYFVLHLGLLLMVLALGAMLVAQPSSSVTVTEKVAGLAVIAGLCCYLGRRIWRGWKNRTSEAFFERGRYVTR